ncbi:MAG: response regulator [Caldilineaceae bacterium]|nr:response regulator [Caldilineaceae bacterium]
MQETLVLVVEDEGIVGMDIQRRLLNMGYAAPEVVATGNQAIQRALALRPQLVLMDIRLKGDMDGISAAEQIRRLLQVPVIFLTAYADEDTLRRAKVTEPHGYVLKPFEERELHIAIEMALYKHRMESRLRESERWLATTLNSISDAIITTDAQGRVNLVNPTASALTGWPLDEALGRPFNDVCHIIDEQTRVPDRLLVATALAKRTNPVLDPSGLLISRTGDEIPIRYHATAIHDDRDDVTGVVVVFRDVAEQRKVEQELMRVQKLESLGLMAGGVAHDFNNLLSAVVNNVALLKMGMEPNSPLYRRLELVEKALWRGTELTQQLLTFARGGAPVRRLADVSQILRDATDLALTGTNIQPVYHFGPGPCLAEIDVGQVGHAIHNLLVNAKEAMPAGGITEINLEQVWIQAEQYPPLQPGQYAKITVRDHGVGIAPENLERIFDPYFTTKPRGSGLGLATVHSIVKRHDGHITVESTPGVGATFAIYLPTAEGSISDIEGSMEQEKIVSGKGRVLIMDDEELIREATGALLEHLGYDYETAKDGAEAIELYRLAMEAGHRFDAVILDLTVPNGMGGQEALIHLQAVDPQVKTIVSSGYFHDPVVANYRSHGFSGVVSKPYTIEEMSETLYRLIQLDSSGKTT